MPLRECFRDFRQLIQAYCTGWAKDDYSHVMFISLFASSNTNLAVKKLLINQGN
jgi:hypothetical protein